MNLLKLALITVILSAILTTTGCGFIEREVAGITGGGFEACHKGVAYVQFTSGASVAYNTDGSISLCE